MGEQTAKTTASPILRGSRMFLELKSLGEVNEKGKVVLSFGFKGKNIAGADSPLRDLVMPLAGEVARMARWSSHAAMKADFDALAEFVNGMKARADELAAMAGPAGGGGAEGEGGS